MIEYIYWDFESNPVSIDEYRNFLHEYYGELASERYKRLKWYSETENYHLLLAMYNGRIVGQSSAYKVTATCFGETIIFWWSVDTFVLPKFLGKGIGKGLQKKLHIDHVNFSSLWYSRANGAIKQKCGANAFLLVPFNYFPVNSFFSVIANAIQKTKSNKPSNSSLLLPNIYYRINRFFSNSGSYLTKEVNLNDSLKDLMVYIENSLKQYDFYVQRDFKYMHWKYITNPTLKEYHTICFYSIHNPNELLGMVIFSGVFTRTVFATPSKVVTILDCFVFNETKFSKRMALLEVISYFHRKRIVFDGCLTLDNISYYPFLRYPYKGSALLSTYNNKQEIKHWYFSYSDQDMEQMIL